MDNTADELLELLEDLVDKADGVVRAWSEGDLADAVNELETSANDARDMIEAIKGQRVL